MTKIAPSVLAADFARLGSEALEVRNGGADYLHIDVMDGHFVPNISVGLPVVASLRSATDMTLDVHLMIDRPQRYVREFCGAGADIVTLHVESCQPQDIYSAVEAIKKFGKKAGLALKPKSPAAVLNPYLELIDLALVMTVEPGFGGQSFILEMLPKISELRSLIDAGNPSCELEVDGGINLETARLAALAGANVLVAGSAVFGKKDRKAAIESLRE